MEKTPPKASKRSARTQAELLLGVTRPAPLPSTVRRPMVGRPLAGAFQRLPDTPEGRLAGRVRAFRVSRGLSQAALASRVSGLGQAWHQTTVAKTERGERELRYAELLVLAEALDVPLELLMGLEGKGESQPEAGLRADLLYLEQEERLLGLRLGYVERDLESLLAQRKQLRDRLAALKKELTAARRANSATAGD